MKPSIPQQTVHEIKATCEEILPYLLYQPEGDAPAAGWPVVFFLHGAGERGADLTRVTTHGPPRLVKEGAQFPFILVSPQCAEGRHWSTHTLIVLINRIVETLAIDPCRVYLTGVSMGGFGTWDLACEYPERFAAIAPICGGGELIRTLVGGDVKHEALKTLPVWAFHGEVDEVVPLRESQRMVDLFRHLGNECVKLTVYPGVGHDSWTPAYDTSGVLEWLLQQSR